MANKFITADLHLSHQGIIKFNGANGDKLRPWDSIEEMNETIITNWNTVVKPDDTVFLLGDVAMNKSALPLVARLRGKKILIPGNHDNHGAAELLKYFYDIQAYRKIGDYVLTHVPIHPGSIPRWATANVHGHLHSGRVKLENGEIDPRYICVSVEHTNYTPVALEEIEDYR